MQIKRFKLYTRAAQACGTYSETLTQNGSVGELYAELRSVGNITLLQAQRQGKVTSSE